jgi:hypothetical protein
MDRDQDIRRLALLALTRDLRILIYPPTSEVYCTSRSEPDCLHRVTRLSCDCRGFIQRGRCSHHALLLHHLGELPPADPTRAIA